MASFDAARPHRRRTLDLPAFLKGRGLGRAMAHVGGATALSQLMGLAVLPLVSRHLGPVSFGQFGLFFTLATTLGAAGALGLPEAMLAARRWSEALALLAACLRAVALMGVVCAAITYVLFYYDAFGLEALPDWSAVAMAPVVWLISLMTVLQLWLVRRRRFTSLAKAYVAQGVLRAGTQVALSFAAAGLGWLVLLSAELCGRLSTGLVMGAACRREVAAAVGVRAPRWRAAVRRYWRFPVFRTPSMFANNLAAGLPLFLFSSAYSPADIGAFSFMMAIIVGPIGLVQRAVGDVFLGEFAARYRRDPAQAKALLFRTAAALAALALPATLILARFGPFLFSLVFGAAWRGAGVLAAAYAPAFLANMAVAPLGGALNVANRPGYKLLVDLVGIAVLVVSFFVTRALHASAAGAAGGFAIASAGAYGLYFLLILRAVRNAPAAATVDVARAADGRGDAAA